jgi:MarR family transcriptional regulator, transcriptional regulator for hemolysin
MSASAPSRTVVDLSLLLSQASHALTTRMAAAFAEIDITPREYCVLFHALEAERTQIQLATISDLDKTTMVTTVDRLEKAGLAERRPSTTDRRARIIAVTEAGERAVAAGMRVADRVHREALAGLPEDHREIVVGALWRLVDDRPREPDPAVRLPRRPRSGPAK